MSELEERAEVIHGAANPGDLKVPAEGDPYPENPNEDVEAPLDDPEVVTPVDDGHEGPLGVDSEE